MGFLTRTQIGGARADTPLASRFLRLASRVSRLASRFSRLARRLARRLRDADAPLTSRAETSAARLASPTRRSLLARRHALTLDHVDTPLTSRAETPTVLSHACQNKFLRGRGRARACRSGCTRRADASPRSGALRAARDRACRAASPARRGAPPPRPVASAPRRPRAPRLPRRVGRPSAPASPRRPPRPAYSTTTSRSNGSTVRPSPSASRSTRTASPSCTTPDRIARASWSSICRCMSRRSGRAP